MLIVPMIMHWPFLISLNQKPTTNALCNWKEMLSLWMFFRVCMFRVHCKLDISFSCLVYWRLVRPVWRCCGICAVSLELSLGCWEQSGWLMNDLSEVMRSRVPGASWLPPHYSTDSLPRQHHLSSPDWLEKSVSPLSQRCTRLCLKYFELYVED